MLEATSASPARILPSSITVSGVEDGQQSELVPTQPRSRKGSKTTMAMHRAETVGLVEPTPEMVELVSHGAMGDDGGGNAPKGGSLAGRLYAI